MSDYRAFHIVLLPLFLIVLSHSSASQPLANPSGYPSLAWEEITFAVPRTRLESATSETLVAMALFLDLQQPAEGILGEATLALNAGKLTGDDLIVYLNPGLELLELRTLEGENLPYERQGEVVKIAGLSYLDESPFRTLVVRYGGILERHWLFDQQELSSGFFQNDYALLAPESLYYPLMPGQSFTGRLRVLTAPGVAAYSAVGEERIIETDGVRTTDFVWFNRISRLALATSSWHSAQVQRGTLLLEMVVPPELAVERSMLYTMTYQKVDFFGRAFHPYLWDRLTLVSRPDEGAPADGQGLIVLPADEVRTHLLGHPLLDRMLARQWFGQMVRFIPQQQVIEQGWVEFAARLYREDIFESRAQSYWVEEGRWLTRLAQPQVPYQQKIPWILRMIQHQLGRPAFWELNQEFFQRFLYQDVMMADYLDLAEEIFAEEPPGDRLRSLTLPWFHDRSIPILTYSADIISSSPPQLIVSLEQQTEVPWEFPIELSIESLKDPVSSAGSPDGIPRRETIWIKDATATYVFSVPDIEVRVVLDPDWKVLCKRTEIKTPKLLDGTFGLD